MVDDRNHARRAAAWAGVPWDAGTEAALSRYVDWLRDEAMPGGGLGSGERGRIWSRHIGDSLLFAGCWPHPEPPEDLLDIGSGVGLPGIPLAVVWPGCAVTLLDRSERRCALARRAVRILDLDNVSVVGGDANRYRARHAFVVSRAVLAPEAALALGRSLCRSGGSVAVGLSHLGSAEATERPGVEMVVVPVAVLDSPVRLLRMTVGGA